MPVNAEDIIFLPTALLAALRMVIVRFGSPRAFCKSSPGPWRGNCGLSELHHSHPIFREGLTNKGPTMNTMTSTRKVLLFLLLATITLVGLAFLLASAGSAFGADHTLMFFDEDLSGSVIGWMVAIPILIVAIVAIVVSLALTGIVAAIAMAMVLMIALVVAVFGVLLGLIPIAAFLAVPAAIIWALIKINRRNAAAAAAHAAPA